MLYCRRLEKAHLIIMRILCKGKISVGRYVTMCQGCGFDSNIRTQKCPSWQEEPVWCGVCFLCFFFKVADQQQRMMRKDAHIASLQQSINAQHDVSYDGTFLWKISNVSQKLREAATGLKSSQYSPGIHKCAQTLIHTHTLQPCWSCMQHKRGKNFILPHVVREEL